MCCIAEIAMSVFGLVTLIRGQFSLSRSKVVRGTPAYIIGGLLLSTLPIALGLGMVIGFVLAARTGQPPTIEEMAPYGIVDVVVVVVILAAVLTVALSTARDEAE